MCFVRNKISIPFLPFFSITLFLFFAARSASVDAWQNVFVRELQHQKKGKYTAKTFFESATLLSKLSKH